MEVDQSSNQCVIPWWFCILKYAIFIHCSSQFLYLFMKSCVGPSNWLGLPEAITLAARFAHKWEAQGDFFKTKINQQTTQTTNQQPSQTFAKNTPLVYYGWVDGFVDVDVFFSCHHLLGLIFQCIQGLSTETFETRWWFQILFMFTPNLGEMIQFWLIWFQMGRKHQLYS